jgi:hypothetical protein
VSDPAYDRMTDMFTRKAEQTIAYAALIGAWQGLADRADLAMRIGDTEWLQSTVADMKAHSEACEKEMKSWL